jgi:hypothetical protein
MTRATLVFVLASAVLAILASTLNTAAWLETTLWVAALAAGTVALIAAYGVAITWARRRKRLWG